MTRRADFEETTRRVISEHGKTGAKRIKIKWYDFGQTSGLSMRFDNSLPTSYHFCTSFQLIGQRDDFRRLNHEVFFLGKRHNCSSRGLFPDCFVSFSFLDGFWTVSRMFLNYVWIVLDCFWFVSGCCATSQNPCGLYKAS